MQTKSHVRLSFRVQLLSICFVILLSIVSLSMTSLIHEQMALLLKSPIRHFQTIPPFTGTDQFDRVTILALERVLVGLEVARTDTGGE